MHLCTIYIDTNNLETFQVFFIWQPCFFFLLVIFTLITPETKKFLYLGYALHNYGHNKKYSSCVAICGVSLLFMSITFLFLFLLKTSNFAHGHLYIMDMRINNFDNSLSILDLAAIFYDKGHCVVLVCNVSFWFLLIVPNQHV